MSQFYDGDDTRTKEQRQEDFFNSVEPKNGIRTFRINEEDIKENFFTSVWAIHFNYCVFVVPADNEAAALDLIADYLSWYAEDYFFEYWAHRPEEITLEMTMDDNRSYIGNYSYMAREELMEELQIYPRRQATNA